MGSRTGTFLCNKLSGAGNGSVPREGASQALADLVEVLIASAG